MLEVSTGNQTIGDRDVRQGGWDNRVTVNQETSGCITVLWKYKGGCLQTGKLGHDDWWRGVGSQVVG